MATLQAGSESIKTLFTQADRFMGSSQRIRSLIGVITKKLNNGQGWSQKNSILVRDYLCGGGSGLHFLIDAPAQRGVVCLLNKARVLHCWHRIVIHCVRYGSQGNIDIHAVRSRLVEDR